MNNVTKKITTFFSSVIVAFVLLYSPYQAAQLNTQYAMAGGGGNTYTETTGLLALIEQGLTAIKSTITAAATTAIEFATGNLWFKENVLDGIAWTVAKTLLSQMTQSIVNWINSGFQGSPAFVTDLGGFLQGVADSAAGEFISETLGLGFLCSPFELDIQIALSVEYAARRDNAPPACTLSDVVNNIDGFLDGSFTEGGWEGWFEITQRPQNTPYGAYLYAQVELNDFVLRSQLGEQKILDFGQGFFSQTICETISGPGADRENCAISTPGQVLETRLNESLGLGEQSLVTADEFNEIIAALFGQLAQQAVTGVNGLLGLSGGTGFTDYSYAGGVGTQSFIDGLSQQSQGVVADPSTIQEGINRVNELISYYQYVISFVNDLETRNNANRAAYPNCYNVSVPSSLTNRRTNATAGLVQANNTLLTLQALQTRLAGADAEARNSLLDNDPTNDLTTADIQNEIFGQYQALVSSGSIPTSSQVVTLQVSDRQELQDAVSDFESLMSSRVQQCQQQQNNGNGGGFNNGGGNQR